MKLMLAAALLAVGTVALAHEGHETSNKEVRETVIIKRIHGEPGKDHPDHAMIAKCDGAADVDVSDEGKDGDKVKRSRVVICNKGAQGPRVVEALERARKSIEKQEQLSADARTKALAAIDRAIERHKGNAAR